MRVTVLDRGESRKSYHLGNCNKSSSKSDPVPASLTTTLSQVRGMAVSSVTVTDRRFSGLQVVSLLSVNQLELKFPLTVKPIRARMNVIKLGYGKQRPNNHFIH